MRQKNGVKIIFKLSGLALFWRVTIFINYNFRLHFP